MGVVARGSLHASGCAREEGATWMAEKRKSNAEIESLVQSGPKPEADNERAPWLRSLKVKVVDGSR